MIRPDIPLQLKVTMNDEHLKQTDLMKKLTREESFRLE